MLQSFFLPSSPTGPPRITQPPANLTAVNGSNVSFVCDATADPHHNITWQFNGTTIITTYNTSNTSQYSINRENGTSRFGTLTVYSIAYQDRGSYQCTAVNYLGEASATATLVVHGESAEHTYCTLQCTHMNKQLSLHKAYNVVLRSLWFTSNILG